MTEQERIEGLRLDLAGLERRIATLSDAFWKTANEADALYKERKGLRRAQRILRGQLLQAGVPPEVAGLRKPPAGQARDNGQERGTL